MTTTIIVFRDGYVDQDDIDRAVGAIGGEVALIPAADVGEKVLQIVTDNDGLRIVEIDKLSRRERELGVEDRSRRDRPVDPAPAEPRVFPDTRDNPDAIDRRAG